MAGVVRSLITRILFKSDPSGLKKVETHAAEAKRQMRSASRAAFKLKRDLAGLGGGMKTLVLGVATGAFAKYVIHDFAKAADGIAKFSKATGMGSTFLQQLYHSMALGGATQEDSEKGIKRFAKVVNDAHRGLKSAKDSFNELVGLDPKAIKADEKGIFAVADAMAKMTDEGKRAALAQELFGRAGLKLIPGLEGGSEAMKKQFAEALKLGNVIDKKGLKAAEDYTDEMHRSKQVLLGVRNMIALKLLPAITKNLKAFRVWAAEGDNLKRFLAKLVVALKAVAAAMLLVAAVKLGQALTLLVRGVKVAVMWFRALGVAQMFAYAKLVLIAAAIAAVVLIIQSLVVWSRGGKSFIGDLLEKFGLADKAKKLMNGLVWAVKAIYPYLVDAAKAWLRFAGAVLNVYVTLWPKIKAGMIEVANAVARAWREDLKPAILDTAIAIVQLWIAARPIIAVWWAGMKKIWGTIWDLAMWLIPVLGAQFGVTFSIISALVKAATGQLWLFLKIVEKIADAIKWVLDKKDKLLGKTSTIDMSGVVTKTPGDEKPRRKSIGDLFSDRPGMAEKLLERLQGMRAGNNNVSVGALSVSINGTTSMTADEIAAAVEVGANKAFQSQINDAFTGIRSLVPA